MDEREIFEGSENTLTMNQTYTHQFQCIFDLRSYPFDRQTCTIEMATSNLDAPTMRLIPKEQKADMNFFQDGFTPLDVALQQGHDKVTSETKVLPCGRPPCWLVLFLH